MNPGLVVKLRPAGPWRIGPDSGARNRVDVIYHSDSLYAAVTGALSRLGSLEEWLGATARQDPPAVCFSSCFPFLDEIGFVIPPRTIWPPTSPALLSARVRWKSARFVPLGIVQALLAGQTLDGNHWSVDGPSECLVPAGRPGPFRTGVRFNAAVDRLTGAAERHSTACIEFRAGSGLWAIVSFRDEAARARWSDPVKAAFRLLADSGFGGERSRGWGRSETPEFIDGTLPDMILPKPEPAGPLAAPIEPRPEPGQPEEAGPEPVPESTVEATPELAEPEPAEPLAASVESRPELAPMAMPPEPDQPEQAEPEPVPESTVEAAPIEAASLPAAETGIGPEELSAEAAAEPPIAQAEIVAPASAEPALEVAGDPPAASEAAPAEPAAGQPNVEAAAEPPAETEAAAAGPATGQPNAEGAAEPPAEPEKAPAEAAPPSAEPAPGAPAAEAAAEPEPSSPTPVAEPPVPGPRSPEPKAPAYWLLSLFTPAASDAIDWRRGNYKILARGGRIDSPAGSGELKKQLNMVAEGSVLLAGAAPCGSAPDVAPEGFAHPVFRAGFALSIPLPTHHEAS